MATKVPQKKERFMPRKGLISTGADRSINHQSHCELR